MITDLDGIGNEYLIPKDKHVTAHDGQVVTKGESIVDGPADPQDILRLQGREALARYIIDEVQDVMIRHVTGLHQFYGELMGPKIARKHVSWYLQEQADAQSFRRTFNRIDDGTEQLNVLNHYFEQKQQAKAA